MNQVVKIQDAQPVTMSLAGALSQAQAAMKSASFDRTNPHFKSKYASLASVVDTIRKPLADNGLSYTQTTEIRDGSLILVTTLRHISGETVKSEYPLPAQSKPQELGSALTYARRYSLSAIVCIAADDDDDAEGAHKAGQVASLPKKDAKEIYNKMQTEVREWKSREQGRLWMDGNVDRIQVLPPDWQDILRSQCAEMMMDLRNQEGMGP